MSVSLIISAYSVVLEKRQLSKHKSNELFIIKNNVQFLYNYIKTK